MGRSKRPADTSGASKPTYDELVRENARQRERIDKLERLVEQLQRQAKRQSAPFSRDDPKRNPARPGRRAGEAYGTKARRPVPDHVDEEIAVPLPERCPDCASPLELVRTAEQFQEELPVVQAHVTRFVVQVGRCTGCGRRVQARHARQTSDALGAAGVTLGPRAKAVTVQLNKELGIPHAKAAKTLHLLGGITLSAGGVVGVTHRAADAAEVTYDAICDGVAASKVVSPDETGWRVGGGRVWLHVFVGDGVTAYQVACGRGYAEAAVVLGEDFAGILERDGWAPYRKFTDAKHQTCIAHLLRRCNEMIKVADRGQARVPHTLRRILKDALALRENKNTITQRTLDAGIRGLERRIDRLLGGAPRHPPNVRLLRHIENERANLFTFLKVDGVQATNWRSEQAIRPAVVARKHWGGNKTDDGAHTFEVLASFLRTCKDQGADAITLLANLLRNPERAIAPLAIPGISDH